MEEYLKVSLKNLILQKMEFTLKWILQHKQTNILIKFYINNGEKNEKK